MEFECRTCLNVLRVPENGTAAAAKCPVCHTVQPLRAEADLANSGIEFGPVQQVGGEWAGVAASLATGDAIQIDDPVASPCESIHSAAPTATVAGAAVPDSSVPATQAQRAPISYIIRTPNGQQYGPATLNELSMWFNEGRIPFGSFVRLESAAEWFPYDPGLYWMQGAGSYAVGTPIPAVPMPLPMAARPMVYPRQSNGVAVLVLAVLGLLCFVFGIIAWCMANSQIRAIRLGVISPHEEGLLKAGRAIAIVCIVLYVLGIFLLVLGVVLSVALRGAG